VILQVSRTAGETAPILFTGAVLYKAVDQGDLFPYRLTESAMALATHLYNLATQINGVPDSMPFATATVLVGAVLLINSTAVVLRAVLRNRKKW
jgi:phosphate transport system permease protein